jgi:hypothetical protein
VERADKRALPWGGLFCILVIYVFSALRFNPAAYFGAMEDDSIYFSSANALADHFGYILPSVPSQPVATKYPILYPWLLSWAWRWNPSFPANLRVAAILTLAFGMAFLVCSFIFLRGLEGIGDSEALLLTFLTAVHPIVLMYSSMVMSDLPFAALALAAMLTADRAMRPEASGAKTASCAGLTGLAILMRVLGVPIAAGILAAALARRAWRQAAIFCAALIPFGGVILHGAMLSRPSLPTGHGTGLLGPGFATEWTYYTSYIGYWKLSVPNTHILWEMLKNNALVVLFSPSSYTLFALLTKPTTLNKALMFLVTAGVFAGIVRQAKAGGWKPIHFALPFFLAVILFWNYPDTNRFLFPFLPLFLGGLWFEAKHLLELIAKAFRESQQRSEKAIALALGLAVVALVCALAWNYVLGTRNILAMGRDRSNLLAEKREAYQWIAGNTSTGDVVIAYEDASLYLYSGRQSMRPVTFPTSGFYEAVYLQESLMQMEDVAHGVGARYWLISDDDFSVEWNDALTEGRKREQELEQGLSGVFQSKNGRVRIYKFPCRGDSKNQPCG